MISRFFSFGLLIFGLFGCVSDDTNPVNSCGEAAVVLAENTYIATNPGLYYLDAVTLTGNCLEITVGASGCDPAQWELDVVSSAAFYTIFPMKRQVKVVLVNNQLCDAVFQKTQQFDVTPLQIAGQNEVKLQIEGWPNELTYSY